MKININTKKKLSIIGASLTLLSYLSGCCFDKDTVESDNSVELIESTIEITETDNETENSTTEESTPDQNVENSFTVETNSYTNPFSPATISVDDYDTICHNIVSAGPDWMLAYGFDNEFTLNELRNQIYNFSGSVDNTITLSDVSYFQGTERMASAVATDKFCEVFSGDIYSPYTLAYVRAIMQLNGWRFGIDEIPYDYISQRFPGFLESMIDNQDLPSPIQDSRDPMLHQVTDPLAVYNMYDYDYLMFLTILAYNDARLTYIYNNPYGSIDNLTDDVLQVRDAETGRNVLVPTEEQYYQMMEDINSIPGCENIDIAVVETRENFYEAYGYYPEDIINDQMIYEGNASYQMTQGG